MEIHPSQIPISRSFEVRGYSEVWEVVDRMLENEFGEAGQRVLMPKDKDLAKKIGYTVVNELSKGLRMRGYRQKILYFVYHHDAEHYAIVLVSEEAFSKLRQ